MADDLDHQRSGQGEEGSIQETSNQGTSICFNIRRRACSRATHMNGCVAQQHSPVTTSNDALLNLFINTLNRHKQPT